MASKWTWDKLDRNGARLNPRVRGNNYPDTPRFELGSVVPYKGTRTCFISLRAWGVTQPGLHNVIMLFEDVDVLSELPDNNKAYLRDYFELKYKGETYYVKKFDKYRNPINVRCDCFSGDTKVLLGDGTSATLEELSGKTNFEIISFNQATNKFEKTIAICCEKKRKNATVIELELDNGCRLKVTPDHKFLTHAGKWVRADELVTGESLRAIYYKDNKAISDINDYEINQYIPDNTYYVYVYLDPTKPGDYKFGNYHFSYEPIYVGKGKGGRIYSHLRECERVKHKCRFHAKLLNMINHGVTPIIEKLAYELEELPALELESDMIKQIGLRVDGTGPLYNFVYSHCQRLNDSTRFKLSQRMRENNPMKNPETVEKAKKGFINRLAKRGLTIKQFNTERSHRRTKETFEQIIKSREANNPDCYKKFYEGGIAWRRDQIKKGVYHTQTEAFKKAASERWKDPEYRRKHIEKAAQTYAKRRQDKEKYAEFIKKVKETAAKNTINNAINWMTVLIKRHGAVTEENYKRRGIISIKKLKERGVYNECLAKATYNALHNHKVVTKRVISNEDVYCLTVPGLSNFIVDTTQSNEITSGVVVKNCADFFFRLAWYNFYNGNCLYGPAPKPYRRKTTWYPPQNPMKYPGICKHLHNAWEVLRNSGLTVN